MVNKRILNNAYLGNEVDTLNKYHESPKDIAKKLNISLGQVKYLIIKADMPNNYWVDYNSMVIAYRMNEAGDWDWEAVHSIKNMNENQMLKYIIQTLKLIAKFEKNQNSSDYDMAKKILQNINLPFKPFKNKIINLASKLNKLTGLSEIKPVDPTSKIVGLVDEIDTYIRLHYHVVEPSLETF